MVTDKRGSGANRRPPTLSRGPPLRRSHADSLQGPFGTGGTVAPQSQGPQARSLPAWSGRPG
eukprot:1020775-Alexandrium_andersonii.AAC.1